VTPLARVKPLSCTEKFYAQPVKFLILNCELKDCHIRIVIAPVLELLNRASFWQWPLSGISNYLNAMIKIDTPAKRA